MNRREALKAVVATSLVVASAATGSAVELPPTEEYVIENDYPYFGFEPDAPHGSDGSEFQVDSPEKSIGIHHGGTEARRKPPESKSLGASVVNLPT